MSLDEVTRAIKKLGKDDDSSDEEPTSSKNVIEISDDSDNCDSTSEDSNVRYTSDKSENSSRFFCYEDAFLAKDINVEVEGIGELGFPINEKCIEDMIKISSKAKFGRGQETLIDVSVRDTQTIPAGKLKVSIDEQSLSAVLERISLGLNIDKDSTIKPYLYNMLIYGPGQFFKKHQDSEKMPHMIATLVIVLPTIHKGGDLIIEHNNYKHAFFGSQNPSMIKCIAFYSDCHHEIKKVIEGYRVALTYNIVMESSNICSAVLINRRLDKAVANYFDGQDHPKRLIYLLNHSYSKKNLNWGTLKGTDRTQARALFAVAKKQGRMPYLALADCQETRPVDYDYDSEDDDYSDTKVDLYYWVDEHNLNPDKSNFYVNDIYSFRTSHVSNREICYTARTTKLFEPYKIDENNGFTGNAGATSDYWYNRACVVLFPSKWVFVEGFKFAVNEFYELTTIKGNEDRLLEEINKAGDNFMKDEFWEDPTVAEMLFKIVLYLNNKEKAILILSQLPNQLLVVDNLELFLQLETQFDLDLWSEVLKNWTNDSYSWRRTLDDAIPFIEVYKKFATKKDILNFLTTSNWSTLKGYKLALNELYQLTVETGNVDRLLEEINKAGEKFYNYDHWSDSSVFDMLLKIAVYLSNPEKAVTILCRIFPQILDMSKIEALSLLEKQYDINVWAAVMEKRKVLRISDKKFSAEDSKSDIKNLSKFIKKFKSFAPNSLLIEFFVAEIVDKFINKVPMNRQSVYNKIDGTIIAEFCKVLETCVKTGHVTGKFTLIDHAITSYHPLNQADILFKLHEELDPVDFLECKDLKNHTIKVIDEQLNKIDPNSWEISFGIMCSCQFCDMVNGFFKSKSRTKIVIAAAEKIRKHISNNVCRVRNLIATSTETNSIPFKLVIEKQRKVLSDRQDLIKELNVCKTKLQNLIFTELVKTEKENLLESEIVPEDKDKFVANANIKVEEPELRVKTEPVDNFELQNNVEIARAATHVKKENQGTTELQTHVKVEGTSTVRIKSEPLNSIAISPNVKVEPVDGANDCDSGDNSLPPKRKKISDE